MVGETDWLCGEHKYLKLLSAAVTFPTAERSIEAAMMNHHRRTRHGSMVVTTGRSVLEQQWGELVQAAPPRQKLMRGVRRNIIMDVLETGGRE